MNRSLIVGILCFVMYVLGLKYWVERSWTSSLIGGVIFAAVMFWVFKKTLLRKKDSPRAADN